MAGYALKIRAATSADLPRLNALMLASRAYDGAYRAILDGYPLGETQLRRDRVFVAEEAGELLGFYSLIVEGEPELDLLFVADGAQGTGLGAALFDHMRDQARAAGLRTVAIVSHPPSVGFYQRMGAELVGMKPPSGRVSWERPVLRLSIAS